MGCVFMVLRLRVGDVPNEGLNKLFQGELIEEWMVDGKRSGS